MQMIDLTTVHSSNIPMDCHIVKGRLETEGIRCFMFDENIVWVHPFKAVAVGGVKLKVPSDRYKQANNILQQIKKGNLQDENGTYPISDILQADFERQSEVLKVKAEIRDNPSLLSKTLDFKTTILTGDDIEQIINSEKLFQSQTNKRLDFSWKQFFYELFDFDREVFKYFRVRPVEYYLEKEIVANFRSKRTSEKAEHCPVCQSDNIYKGYAIDHKWDVLYFLLSLLIAPMPLMRKKWHCFDCGHDYKR